MSSFDDKTLDDIANSMIQLVKGNLFKNIYPRVFAVQVFHNSVHNFAFQFHFN